MVWFENCLFGAGCFFLAIPLVISWHYYCLVFANDRWDRAAQAGGAACPSIRLELQARFILPFWAVYLLQVAYQRRQVWEAVQLARLHTFQRGAPASRTIPCPRTKYHQSVQDV